MVDKEIAVAVGAALAKRIGEARFQLWFGAHTQFVVHDDILQVVTSSIFFRDWLRKNFRDALEESYRETTGTTPALEFRIDATLGKTPAPKSNDKAASDHGNLLVSEANGLPANVPDQTEPAPRTTGRRFASLGDFVEGVCNKLAFTSAQIVVEQPGMLSPLFVHGPTASGKTHLLEGIYKEARKNRKVQTVYLSAEQFTNGFVEAVRGSGLPNFRSKYRGLDLLLIDDVQFFCGKKATATEFLHTLDTSLREGRQLVFAADRPPAQLPALGAELLTRLESGLVCGIQPPNHEVRLGIVKQLAKRLDITVSSDVAEFVAAHLTAHARELAGAMKLLKATCLAQSCPLSLSLAQEALAEMVHNSAPAVGLCDIEQAVCSVFGLELKTLRTGGNSRNINHPRMLAMWLARKYTRAALSEIGRFFGRRSHSSVISAQKKIAHWVAGGSTMQLQNQQCTTEEAICRVEQRLRVG